MRKPFAHARVDAEADPDAKYIKVYPRLVRPPKAGAGREKVGAKDKEERERGYGKLQGGGLKAGALE